jgi:hypothetical protein
VPRVVKLEHRVINGIVAVNDAGCVAPRRSSMM